MPIECIQDYVCRKFKTAIHVFKYQNAFGQRQSSITGI